MSAASGATVKNALPPAPEPMREESATDSSAVIGWGQVLEEPIRVDVQWYEVWTNSGANGEFVKIDQALGVNSYTATNLTPAKIYKYKVRAANCCG